MKIVIAADAYKGTMSQLEVSRRMKEAIKGIHPQAELVVKPMADGGEGSLDVLASAADLKREISLYARGPRAEKIKTRFIIIEEDKALIELSEISGLPLLKGERGDPMKRTSYGLGEVIKKALDLGIRKFLVALGGSATNDGGFGMLQSLGVRFYDQAGRPLSKYSEDMLLVDRVDRSGLDQRLEASSFTIISDVKNKLLGKEGATFTFGPQKGIKAGDLAKIDEGMSRYARKSLKAFSLKDNLLEVEGSGAAGGLAFAFLLLAGEIVAGASFIAREIGLEAALRECDLVFTGEGKSDQTTISGKAPIQVAKIAKKYQLPCILVSGVIEDQDLLEKYFTKVYSIVDQQTTKSESMDRPGSTLMNKMKKIIKETISLKKQIHTEKAPAAIGPYSQAIEAGDFVYVSGQLGLNPETRELEEGIEAQTKQMMENAKVILEEAGLSLGQVVKCTIYLSSMDHFATVNEIYASYLEEPYPARVAIEVSRLPNDGLVEMDLIAYKK